MASNSTTSNYFQKSPNCSATYESNFLTELHEHLCHPGISRLMHFVRSKNLPFSMEDVKRVTSQCRSCAEIKPRYFKPPVGTLIKATQPYERLSVDFKGPLPSITKNRYLLTIVDEYSRFPFAFPCPDMTASTINNCYTQLFSMFGMPSYVHSDRGPSFMSREVKTFLTNKGVATSRTCAYNPQGNGQVERLNGTIWKAITLALKSQGLPDSHWEQVLPQALHSIRSLLCTSTNETPHERFFKFSRKSQAGTTLPSWLSNPGIVLMKKNVRQSKYDPLVEEVELIESNPHYAYVRLSNGKETTVSTRQLAPAGERSLQRVTDETNSTDLDIPPDDIQIEQVVDDNTVRELSSPSINSENEYPTNSVKEIASKQQRVRPYELRGRVV